MTFSNGFLGCDAPQVTPVKKPSFSRKQPDSTGASQEVYGVFDAGPVQTDYFEGRHRISGQLAYDFLAATL